jgi:hypothetical protein
MVADTKKAGFTGLILGLLFGRLGVIASFALDQRDSCAYCGGKLNGKPELCQHCRSPLTWENQASPHGPAKSFLHDE